MFESRSILERRLEDEIATYITGSRRVRKGSIGVLYALDFAAELIAYRLGVRLTTGDTVSLKGNHMVTSSCQVKMQACKTG